MRQRLLVGFAAAILIGVVVAVSAVSAAASTPSRPSTTQVVSMVNFAFSPDPITIPVGTTLQWHNTTTTTPHTATADDGSFDTGTVNPQANSILITFTTPGTFAYHCIFHGAPGGIGMAGTIIVQAATPTPTPTATATPTPTATATPAPDLVESALSNPPATVNVGGSFSVTDTTLNRGNASAGSSRTRYLLSLDQRRNAGDVLLMGGRAVPALAPHTQSSGMANVTVPTTTASGTYFLLACADDLHQVTESNERNNCRASATTVQITGGATQAPSGSIADSEDTAE